MKKWLWISGWGLPPDWFRSIVNEAIPDTNHVVLSPNPRSLESVVWKDFDHIGGFSLGAFLLLQHQEKLSTPALLLSPFFGYTSEMNFGGKIRQVQVRYLARWLQRDPFAALADFYQRAKLPLPAPDKLPYALEELLQGLEILATEQAPLTLPPDWTALLGNSDPLLDANTIHALAPQIKVVENAGHDPRPLLRAWIARSDA